MNTGRALFGAGCVVGGWMLFIAFHAAPAKAVSLHTEPTVHAAYDPTAIDSAIAFHKERVKRDPKGPIGWAMLSDAWLARSRESDSDAAAWQAEEAARKSLALRERGNSHGIVCLVESLLEQHRFQDAIQVLENYHVRSRIYADVLIEVGRYDDAEKVLSKLNVAEDPSVKAAVARLAAARGDHDASITSLQASQGLLLSNAGVPNTTIAWFNVKLGDEYRKHGEDDKAESLYRQALAMHPRNYKANLAMAKLMLSRKDWNKSIEFSMAALKIADSMDAKSMLGDAYKGLGNDEESSKWYAQCFESYQKEVALFDKLGKGGPLHVRPIDRQFAMFCAEHKMFVKDGLVAAKRDLANRPDPHAHETLATLQALVSKS